MTLRLFIKTIKASGKISESQNAIAIKLYNYSGLFSSESTVIKSIKGRRRPIYNQGSLNEAGFIRYFEERTNSTWTYMQEDFGKLDEYGFIDQDTTDRRIFYESLLALFYDILRLVPVSLCNILPPNPLIFGREREIKQLSDIFRNSNCAIVTGIGGIGKSSMALSYAHNLTEHGHWTVQHMICENTDTLQNAIIKLQFNGLTDIPKDKKDSVKKNFEMRIACLKNSIKHMLIVLDNLNWPFTSEDRNALKKLMECGSHVRILITSRNRLVDDKRHVINLSPLDESDLLKLYIYHRFEDSKNHKEYITQHNDILIKLFSLVEGHTLLVELLAKLPNRTFVGEHEIYNRLARPCLKNKSCTKGKAMRQ